MSDALAVEHEIQRLMLERLGIEWTPGEPFYSLVEAEITRLRAALEYLCAVVERQGYPHDWPHQLMDTVNAALARERGR